MPQRRLKFGLFLPCSVPINRQPDFDAVMRFAYEAEEVGYDSLWVSHGVLRKTASAGSVKFSCIPTMAALAARTTRVRIGSDVLMGAQFNPIILAQDLATVDHISHGRLIAGVGVGSVSPLIEREYQILGVPYNERGRRLEEVVQVMKKLWSEEKVTYRGKYFNLEEIVCEPKPFHRNSIPVYFAGKVRATFQRVATIGDGWLEHPVDRTPQDMKEGNRVIDELARKTGRDPQRIERLKHFHVNLDYDKERAREDGIKATLTYLGKNYTIPPGSEGKMGFFGTPSEFIKELEEYVAAGMQTAIIDLTIGTLDPWRLFRTVTEDIVPSF